MDQRLGLGNEVRELKLGSTFNTPKPRTSFHTLKYDFKPASVDLSKTATLDVSSNNQVTVTMPHLDSSGVPKTVFKGNQRNYTKECVLIIDKVTGEITLEKLHHNIQVKKTRSEINNKTSSNFSSHQSNTNNASGSSGGGTGASGSGSNNSGTTATIVPQQTFSIAMTSERPQYPQNNTQRVSNKTRVSTGIRKNALGSFVQRHSPIQGSPSYPHHRSPQQAPAWNANNGQSTLPSIPLIGMDDDIMPMARPTTNNVNNSSINAATAAAAASSTSNLDGPNQLSNYHSNKPLKSSPKMNAPSNPISQSSHSANKTNLKNSNQQTFSSLKNNSSYDKMQQSRQSNSSHHHRNNNNHQQHQTLSSTSSFVPELLKDISSEIGVLSSSDSSDSSDSDSNSNSNSNSSDSDSNSNSDDDDDDNDGDNNMNQQHTNVISKPPQLVNNGTGPSLPTLLLDEDLRLSSNSSDSDDD